MIASKFWGTIKLNDGYKISFFMKVVVPTLNFMPIFNNISSTELKLMEALTSKVPLFKLTSVQAQTYCQVLMS